MVVFIGFLIGFFLDGLILRSLRCIKIYSMCRNISVFSYIRLYRAVIFSLFFTRGRDFGGRYVVCFSYSFIVSFVCFINYYLQVSVFLQFILLFLFCLLLLIAVLDYKTRLIPDFLSYAVFWLGVFLFSKQEVYQLVDGLYVALFAYASLKFLQQIYLLGLRKDALGDADPLLAFSLAVWLDFWQLPYLFLLAVFATLVPILFSGNLKSLPLTMQIPFGPGLAFAGFVLIEFNFLKGPLFLY